MTRAAREAGGVVAFVPDLMDRSKLAAAGDVTFVGSPGQLAEAAAQARLVIVDLTRPGVLDVLPGVEARVIGFANHTNRELMDAARAAGCDEVMARSAFFSRLGTLLDR
jgi:hypothetical protein